MGGEISLDDEYDSGIPGQPGTRFLVDLKVPPLEPPSEEPSSRLFVCDDDKEYGAVHGFSRSGDPTANELSDSTNATSSNSSSDVENDVAGNSNQALPEGLSVLLVDDDSMIRKMFSRAIASVAPTWTFRQAANGETALRITEGEQFDIIFMDMYMASVEKQLLGTETVAEMRARGIKSRICGLSANDKGDEFLESGADTFVLKPFPCSRAALTAELVRVLYGDP